MGRFVACSAGADTQTKYCNLLHMRQVLIFKLATQKRKQHIVYTDLYRTQKSE